MLIYSPKVLPPQERLVPESPEPGVRDLACGELTYTNIGSGVFVKASETLSTMAEAYLSKYLAEGRAPGAESAYAEESPTEESTTAAGSEHGSHCGGGVGSFHLVAAGGEGGSAPHASPVPVRVMPPASAFCPDASSVEEELARAEAAAVATMGASADGGTGRGSLGGPRVWALSGRDHAASPERVAAWATTPVHRPLPPEVPDGRALLDDVESICSDDCPRGLQASPSTSRAWAAPRASSWTARSGHEHVQVAAPTAEQPTEYPRRAPARPVAGSAKGGARRSPAKTHAREGIGIGHHDSLSISLDDMEPVRPGAVGPLIRVGGGHIFIDQAWVAYDGRVFARDRAGTGLYELRQGRAGEAVVGVRVSKRP